jgi:hypothetical protein
MSQDGRTEDTPIYDTWPEWDVEDEPDFDDDELGVDPEECEDEDG